VLLSLLLVVAVSSADTGVSAADTQGGVALASLLNRAIVRNPEIAAARARAAAAEARVSPASSLDDPMLEAGVLNTPLPSFSLSREEMTMQMVGLTQRVPYPGKRALRGEVARGNAAALQASVSDTRDQVLRELSIAYEELAATAAEASIVDSMRAALEEYVTIAEARYAVGEAIQSDVLQAQAQLGELQRQLLELQRRHVERQAAIGQLTGQASSEPPVEALPQRLAPPAAALQMLVETSRERPRAAALVAQSARAQTQIHLMQREFYPDIDIKLSYGRRNDAPDGMPRDDMVSLTFGVNLPIWRKQRLNPQVAEARAMLGESEAMLRALELETRAQLTQRHAAALQAQRAAELYDTLVVPSNEASVNASLAAYRVGKVDFLTLLETRIRLFESQMSRVQAVAEHNSALADLDYLAGRLPDGVEETP
jgi:outer membrane protein TolC